MKKLVILAFALAMVGCSSLTNKQTIEEKYQITETSMENWGEIFNTAIKNESQLEDWYGAENPMDFVAKTGKVNEKQAKFLDSLSQKETFTKEDKDEFVEILTSVINKLPREFKLQDENIKDPLGLAKKMVASSYLPLNNPSIYIKENVATEKEWAEIVELSNKDSITSKEAKSLRKTLNKLIGRTEFFNSEAWYLQEVSPRVVEINNIFAKTTKTGQDKNNVNAKALYIAYPEYFSELEKWED